MLKLPNQLSDPKANEIVKIFVNERLINLMEEIIFDEVAWKMSLSTYEDLRKYEENCFWDHDFMMLNEMPEEELIKSDLNEVLGIADPKPSNVIEFPFRQSDGKEKNIKAKVIVHPWDAEDE